MILLCSWGCAWSGPVAVPAPQFASASVRLRSDVAQRLRDEATPTRSSSADVRLVSLPRGWEPSVASRQWTYIVLHHSATDRGDVAMIDAEHRGRTDSQGNPWLGIGYHFVIGNGRGMPDGHIEPTFRWLEQMHCAHAGSRPHNDLGIGICLIGNFDEESPTPLQMAAVRRLVHDLSDRYSIATENVLRHADVKATACPGSHFPYQELLHGLSAREARLTPIDRASRRTGLSLDNGWSQDGLARAPVDSQFR